jgi:tetratricopeptide (TPR) repeat protein
MRLSCLFNISVIRKQVLKSVLSLLIIVFAHGAYAQQPDSLLRARMYTDTKQYDKAIPLFKVMYNENPADIGVYNEYLNVLLAAKKYKDAQNIAEDQQRMRPQNPLSLIDIGRVYQAAGKEKKATEQYDKALTLINGDDMLTQQMATAFNIAGNDKYAILTYERARDMLRNPYMYYSPLARLYAKSGEIEKAVNALLDGAPGNIGGAEDTKASMLEFLGNDPKKLQLAQKAVVKRINAQPDNVFCGEILTWLYTQKGDWDGALMQIEAIDIRNKENGTRIIEFAKLAEREFQYDIAAKALDAVIELGKEQPMYAVAKAQKLEVLMQRLEANPDFTAAEIDSLSKEYSDFFTEYPQYYTTETMLDYARLEAQYNNNADKGVELLEKAIRQPIAARNFIGKAKLQLGDYQILQGKIWDASLTYGQVDKSFREDMLGEEARFRNAKVSYYLGLFTYAQSQLNVLKASTSELIANDALYLSVLITENITSDSNLVPLNRFAYADLLLFQNKDKEAETLLDSISQAFPKHPLRDDILLLHAKLSVKHKDYNKALDYLKDIYIQYGKDVLGDDAVFKTAEIYQNYLKQNEQAKHFYEQLILDYPGSTYVQAARKRLADLQPAVPAAAP